MNEKNKNLISQEEARKQDAMLFKYLEGVKAEEAFSLGRHMTISEVIALLQREKFEVTQQQLRKYEAYGLLVPVEKTQAKYRLYDRQNVEQLKTILVLRLIDIPLRTIKRYFELIASGRAFAEGYLSLLKDETYKEVSVNIVQVFPDDGGRAQDKEDSRYMRGIDWKKIEALSDVQKADLKKYLQDNTELELILFEIEDKWRAWRDLSNKYCEVFETQARTASVIGKRLASIVEKK